MKEDKLLNLTKDTSQNIFDKKLVEQIWFDGPLFWVYAKAGKEMLLKAQINQELFISFLLELFD